MNVRYLVETPGSRWLYPYRLGRVLLIAFLSLFVIKLVRRGKHPKLAALKRERLLRTLETALYRLVMVPLIAFLPAPLAYWLACRRGDWCYRYRVNEREQIVRNLEGVLGNQLSLAERTRVARDFYRCRSCEAVDIMRIMGKGQALARLVEMSGCEHLEAALAAGKGVIIASGHFGFHTCCFSLLGISGFPITVIGRQRWRPKWDPKMSRIQRIGWRFLNEEPVAHHWHRTTIEPGPREVGSAVQAASILHANEVIGICIDPPPEPEDRRRAISVAFLGRQALLLPGCVYLAQLTGAPLLMAFLRRTADWHHQVLEISPPVPMDGDVPTAFERCVNLVDAAIRQDPAHWAAWGVTDTLVNLGLLPDKSMQASP